MKVTVLRTNGTMEQHEVAQQDAIGSIAKLIGADILDSVNLRDGRVILVDDTGAIDGKPVNKEASALYHTKCIPSAYPYALYGDAAVALDADFA